MSRVACLVRCFDCARYLGHVASALVCWRNACGRGSALDHFFPLDPFRRHCSSRREEDRDRFPFFCGLEELNTVRRAPAPAATVETFPERGLARGFAAVSEAEDDSFAAVLDADTCLATPASWAPAAPRAQRASSRSFRKTSTCLLRSRSQPGTHAIWREAASFFCFVPEGRVGTRLGGACADVRIHDGERAVNCRYTQPWRSTNTTARPPVAQKNAPVSPSQRC